MGKNFNPNRLFKQEYYFLLEKGALCPPTELLNKTLSFVEGEDYRWARDIPVYEVAEPDDDFDLWYFSSDLTKDEEYKLDAWNSRFERWRIDASDS